MVDLTGDHEVKAVCPRCFGNGFIRIDGVQYDCPQCDSQGWVMLPPINVELMLKEGLSQNG